jgi:hypothetical protein
MTARAVGDYLLDLTMLDAIGAARGGRLCLRGRWSSDAVTALASELEEIWVTGLSSFTSHPAVVELVTGAVDFGRMAIQLAYFLEAENYVDDFEATLTRRPGRAPQRDGAAAVGLGARLAGPLYGPGVELHIDLAQHPEGWCARTATGQALGFSVDGQHRDLGPFNGPWPLIELERGLYAAAGLLLLLG